MLARPSSLHRKTATALLFCFLFQIIHPAVSYGLTSGPSQPEFSGFESVSTTEMVNAFTGDFTYNLPVITVPGPQGSSYPVSLSYQSGGSPEEEASWVGYGWSLNPGAINRNMRGIPDDDDGVKVAYWNKMPRNWTVSASTGVSIEGFSKEFPKLGAGADLGIRYNNYNGFGYNAYLGIQTSLIKEGVTNASFGLSSSETGNSFMVGISPYKNLAGNLGLSLNESPDGITFGASYNPFSGILQSGQRTVEKDGKKRVYRGTGNGPGGGSFSMGGNHGLFSFSDMVRPLAVTPYKGFSVDVKVGLEGDIGGPVGMEGRISGSYSGQRNMASRTPQSFGYLYASGANKVPSDKADKNEEGVIQDYYTEKESPYIKRDKFLGMSFNNADNFSVSGEGVGGGFRLYHKTVGQFTPTYAKSSVKSLNAGLDLHVGPTTFGLGGSFSGSELITTEKAWDGGFGGSRFSDPEDEGAFFRFNNDLGGKLDYQTTDNEPVQASVNINPLNGAFSLQTPPPSAAVPKAVNGRNARSSFVGYTTNGDMVNRRGKSYSKRAGIDRDANRADPDLANKLGEFSVHNTSGMQYIYALPVYARNERHLQVGVRSGAQIRNNYLVYGVRDDDKSNPIYLGQERLSEAGKPYRSAYANTFLLTQINTPDYADRAYDGPDPSDPGGYTLFDYQKVYGNTAGQWYKWRAPYNGLLYQRGTLSDPMDDRASVSEGEKEIYFLSSIKTKTHVAVFVTSPREDGMDAPSSEQAINSTGKGSHQLRKLDRINLYTLSEYENNPQTAKPIKSVLFQYDYSLCKGLPNAANGGGKLTLKKMWFEYYGVQEAGGRISPYAFDYQYPADFGKYPANYRKFGDEFQAIVQNPDFSFFSMDAWGNYQAGGAKRFADMQPWLNQTPSADFDPAAWQLKVIKLPSGGEIHVQYEQDDYAYVQDQPAHIMCALDGTQTGGDDVFYLSNQGLTTDTDRKHVRDMIDRHYVKGQNKMYFKFLYRLLGNSESRPALSDCNAEFISGYASVREVGIAGDKLYVRLGKGDTKQELPKEVCSDFVQSQRVGKLNDRGNCAGIGSLTDNMSDADFEKEDSFKKNAEGMVRKLINMRKIKVGSNLCATFNPALSYLKIPLFADKKGGGLRVKRLFTFDKGIDGEAVLYGNEYTYKAPDPNINGIMRSSGVATNEPSVIREENALVQVIPRFKQEWKSKAIAGVDKKQTEGPLGESLLPGSSVGYSRVIIRNIHSGKTNPGFAVKEYYTANQAMGTDSDGISGVRSRQAATYAFRAEMTGIKSARIYQPVPGLLFNRYVNSAAMTQGFSFFINDMHGKPKRDATYAGAHDVLNDLKNAVLITEQHYQYYEPGEAVPVWNESGQSISLAEMGTEVDVTHGQKAIEERMTQVGVVGDLTVTVFGIFPVPFPVVLPTSTIVRNDTYVHTTTKVIRQTCMLKKMRSYADGIYHTDEYLAFDRNTGQPVWAKSYDEFAYLPLNTGVPAARTPRTDGGKVLAANRFAGGAYAKQTIMAAWQYPGMAGKYLTEGKIIIGGIDPAVSASYTNGHLAFGGNATNACQTLRDFAPGDLVEVVFAGGQSAYYNAGETDVLTQRLRTYPSRLSAGYVPPAGTAVTRLTIVHSGRSNELTVPAGSTTYHNPDGNWETVLTNGLLSYQTKKTVASAAGTAIANPYPFSIPAKVDASALTGIRQFASDLNLQYRAIGATAEGGFTLAGTYGQMNVSAYAAKLPAACVVMQDAAQIRNIRFRYKQANGRVTLQLVSFDAKCQDNNFVTVRN